MMVEFSNSLPTDCKAAMPKISDSEMQFYQFKARQMFLLQKEKDDWMQFCQQKLSKCPECKVENCSPQKDVAIQATVKKTLFTGRKTAQDTKFQNNQLPQELNFIKTKLEHIDLTLSEMKTPHSDRKSESSKVKGLSSDLSFPEAAVLDNLDVRRKHLIQSSLKASLQRLQASPLKIPRTLTSKPRPKNSSFFLPHDLMAQREVSRRSYLLSLTNPKLVVKPAQNRTTLKTGENDKKLSTAQTKQLPNPKKKTSLKSRKKLTLKRKEKVNVSTQVEYMKDDVFEEHSSEPEDENLECAFDGILDDLIGEAVLVLNTIKQKKAKVTSNFLEHKSPALVENIVCETNPNAAKMSNYFNPVTETIENMNNRAEKGRAVEKEPDLKENSLKKTSQTSSANLPVQLIKASTNLQKETAPKIISTSIEETQKIENHRKEFWNYLKRMSWVQEGNFNPWFLADMIAETILDDCITDVCQDIGDLPSVFIAELYSQEFMQHL